MDIRAIITILMLVFTTIAISLSFAGSPNTPQEQALTLEQKKELAGQLGVILKGMTKEEVHKTFGLIEPKIWHTHEGQEVWHSQVQIST